MRAHTTPRPSTGVVVVSQQDTPDWYQPGDIPASLRAADSTVTTDRIVEVLTQHEVTAPRERVCEMVDSARSQLDSETSEKSPSADGDPRSLNSRLVDVGDFSYLGNRDFALVLGAVLSRYEGSFRVPEEIDDLAVDLFWQRQYTTVAFRTVPSSESQAVEQSDVEAVVRGDTAPPTGRAPSVLGIVSNADFTADARSHAADHDIELYGPDHLSRWCRDAQLTLDVLGALLEEGERSLEDVDAVLDDLDPLPDPIRTRDPLGEVIDVRWTAQPANGDGPTPGPVSQPVPSENGEGEKEEALTPGTTGELYADPDEDGDYGAFDRFMDNLEEDSQ